MKKDDEFILKLINTILAMEDGENITININIIRGE